MATDTTRTAPDDEPLTAAAFIPTASTPVIWRDHGQ